MEETKAKMETELCGVCGDFASGRWFSVITCRACGYFFGKHALKRQAILCRFGGNCMIDKQTRICCQKCRLEKCFAIGMKKPVNPFKTQDVEQQQQFEFLFPKTKMCLPSTSSELPVRTFEENKELDILERQMLEELIVANKDLKMPLERGMSGSSLLDVINMTDLAIRRLVQMSMKLKSFTTLSQNDQIALLKYGCTELMILRSVMSYSPEKECWEHNVKNGPKMSIKVDILKKAGGNVYDNYKRVITSFYPQLSSDENIMLILSAIVLFTPERRYTDKDNKVTLKVRQNSYYDLLQSYLYSVYSRCEGKAIYIELKQKIEWLQILNEGYESVYRDVDPNDVLPFLVEIYDLKH